MAAELELEVATGREGVCEDGRVRPLIPVAAPVLAGREREYVADCMESGWISSAGKYVELFEAEFAKFCGVRHAVSCCNGTAALHLSLAALGVGPGDEVIVPTLTFVATANAVTYCGARPVFADSEAETWNLDPAHEGHRRRSPLREPRRDGRAARVSTPARPVPTRRRGRSTRRALPRKARRLARRH